MTGSVVLVQGVLVGISAFIVGFAYLQVLLDFLKDRAMDKRQ